MKRLKDGGMIDAVRQTDRRDMRDAFRDYLSLETEERDIAYEIVQEELPEYAEDWEIGYILGFIVARKLLGQ